MLLVKRLGPSSGDKRYINAIAIAKFRLIPLRFI